MVRLLDVILAFFSLVFLSPLIVILYLLIFLENNSFSKSTIDSLILHGHKIKERGTMGHVNAIELNDYIRFGADRRGSNYGITISKN